MKKYFLIPSAALAVLASGTISATDITDSMSVTASVSPFCSGLTAGDLAFGSTAAADADQDLTTTISVTCTLGTDYTVAIGYGLHPQGVTQRTVEDPGLATTMDYDIFKPDPAGLASTVDGEWGAGADALGNTGTGGQQDMIATGRLHRTSVSPPGAYADTVTVTVTY